MSKFFGGKDPFDDPFFTDPFQFFDMFHAQPPSSHPSKEITIEELDSDGNPINPSDQSKDVVVRNPNGKNANKNPNRQNGNSGSNSFSYQRVAYGGINGMYYTASVAKKAGDDGVVLMEINEEDKIVGEELNTVSRGIHEKGHSVTTKRTSDGKVDTVQTLHNLNEDELVGFEETWRSNSQTLPEWKTGPSLLDNAATMDDGWPWWPRWGGLMLPWTEGEPSEPSDGRTKNVVRINVE